MWRFIFFFRTRLNSVEKKLNALEESGYRTERSLMRYWFLLKDAQPKQTEYFFTVSFLKEYGMGEVIDILKRKYNATEIDCQYMGGYFLSLWRITIPFDDRSLLEELRRSYLIHVINQELLILSFFLFLSLIMVLFRYQATSITQLIISWVSLTASLVFFLWRIVERIILSKDGRSSVLNK